MVDADLRGGGLRLGMALFIICIGLSLTLFLMRVVNLAHGDLGIASSTGQPVLHDLLAAFPATLERIAATLARADEMNPDVVSNELRTH